MSSNFYTQNSNVTSRNHLYKSRAGNNRFKSSVAAAPDVHEKETFLTGTSSIYAEQMLENYQHDPMSVHETWRKYFEDMDNGVAYNETYYNRPTVVIPSKKQTGAAVEANQSHLASSLPSDSLGIAHLIRAYQVNGHTAAKLDPLGLHTKESFPFRPSNVSSEKLIDGWPEVLSPDFHGFDHTKDLDRQLNFKGVHSGGNKGFLEELASMPGKITLRMVLDQLRRTYCSSLAVEYMHIGDTAKCNWIRERVEHPRWQSYDKEKKMHIFERLCFADTFENFMAHKFNTTKRFGLNGGEAIVPALKDAIDRASELGAHSFIIGMPHRGRLNILANVMRKPMPLIFAEFQGKHYDEEFFTKGIRNNWGAAGDVKYHLGSSMDRTYPDGRKIHLSLVANPSHLEAVNPVVVGKARAKQYYCGNKPEDIRCVVPILLHGDAAFAGQGVVYETMQLAGAPDFNVGGTIHVIVNNQIGFTTNPIHSRSTPYCSDLGKAFDAPILHCNGDDPLAVSAALETAVEWRHEWGTDVIVDMVCYRRYGHNELDQPLFTQPKFYKQIANHPATIEIFEKELLESGDVTKEEIDEIKKFTLDSYEKDLETSKSYVPKKDDWLSSKWTGFKSPKQLSRIRPTGVDIDVLRQVGITTGTVPENFKLHRQMEKIFKARKKMAEDGEGIDWGTAEALAFGSLLIEGNHVRITGQDVQRGTFSHRHAVVKDQDTEEEYAPLNHIARQVNESSPKELLARRDTQAGFSARNSILSEYAVVGFELGYSLENPNALILWESQFGDFSNGAQIMIDQFLSAGEDKWLRQSGLVMLLPHGYDGQGAEHSSCRLERFLQMVDEDQHHIPPMAEDERMQIQLCNWQVVNCTTPANYFHCLRRQIHRDFRKPLIITSPKNLLRHKKCVSSLSDMGPGTAFRRVYDETDEKIIENAHSVKRLVFCSGQIYYELLAERQKLERDDVAIVRLEQIAPFAFDRVAANCALYPNAEVVWAQQEPKNMGAYSYFQPRLMTATREINKEEKRCRFVGRPVSAAPATGMSKIHQKEYDDINEGVYGDVKGDVYEYES
uniref:2-oxoglutarate dehydrogenase, mitochondrial n=1 Tax=Eucampia antarctica TaxID=49252 RepID=A0A7S2R3E7_9STRA